MVSVAPSCQYRNILMFISYFCRDFGLCAVPHSNSLLSLVGFVFMSATCSVFHWEIPWRSYNFYISSSSSSLTVFCCLRHCLLIYSQEGVFLNCSWMLLALFGAVVLTVFNPQLIPFLQCLIWWPLVRESTHILNCALPFVFCQCPLIFSEIKASINWSMLPTYFMPVIN